MASSTVIRGGLVVTPEGAQPAELSFADGVITGIGEPGSLTADRVVDADGRVVMPGLIDAHSHLDALVFDPEAQLATLRQGVTTIIAGQDGVSFAPGSGDYASDYFGPLNGHHPSYRGGGVAKLLNGYQHTSPINVGYLVPLGTVRHEVMGASTAEPTADQLEQMAALVAQGLEEGALGVSSGLDYVPGLHASTAELTALCRVVAERDGVYVTHMRGGYEDRSATGTAEIGQIVAGSGVRAHISHYHGEPGLLCGLVDELIAGGARISYDSYFYLRGFTLVAMLTLPPDLLAGDRWAAAAALRTPSVRARLLDEWFVGFGQRSPLGSQWANQLTIAHAPGRDQVAGSTVAAAAVAAGVSPAEFVIDLVADTGLWATGVVEPRQVRPDDAMVPLFTHPAMVGGSDGIAIGAHPHPRAYGNFARYLKGLVIDRSVWSWSDAAWQLAGHTAQIMGLAGRGGRGALRVGSAADLALVDPATVTDRASYHQPRRLAEGIDDVWVNGQQVLSDGELTGVWSGQGLRRRPVG